MLGQTVCKFALGISSLPFDETEELDVAIFAFLKAETSQHIATCLACFDFRYFHGLACDFELYYFKLQKILLHAFLRDQTPVGTNGDAYWYEIIIPEQRHSRFMSDPN